MFHRQWLNHMVNAQCLWSDSERSGKIDQQQLGKKIGTMCLCPEMSFNIRHRETATIRIMTSAQLQFRDRCVSSVCVFYWISEPNRGQRNYLIMTWSQRYDYRPQYLMRDLKVSNHLTLDDSIKVYLTWSVAISVVWIYICKTYVYVIALVAWFFCGDVVDILLCGAKYAPYSYFNVYSVMTKLGCSALYFLILGYIRS